MDGCHLVLVIYYYSFYCGFFFFVNPLLLALESETISHTCLLKREEWCRALLGSSTESTDAKILFNFSDLSQRLHFHLAHQLAQWMFWQVSSL